MSRSLSYHFITPISLASETAPFLWNEKQHKIDKPALHCMMPTNQQLGLTEYIKVILEKSKIPLDYARYDTFSLTPSLGISSQMPIHQTIV